jgi:autotransporter-associated beta strand protein
LTLQNKVDLGDAMRTVAVNANTATISGNIRNSSGTAGLTKTGSGTLVLSGSNSYSGGTVINAGTLTLSGANTYTGGTVLNAGQLSTTADNNLGSGGGITVNGTSTWNMGLAASVTYNRSLTVNDGAVLSLASGNATKTITGVLSGTGSIINTATTTFDFTNTGNTFTGTVNNGYETKLASLGDSANPINLVGSNSNFTWTGGHKTFALRPFTIQAAGTGNINSSGSGALTIQQPLAISGAAAARTLSLGGANTGANQFAGIIANGSGSVVSLTKKDAGTWILSGANTYTGATTITGGTLSISSIDLVANPNPLGQSSAAAANLLLGNGTTLRYTGAAASTDRSFTINGTAAAHGATLNASGAGAINFTSTAALAYGTTNLTRTLTLTGTNPGNNTLAATIANNGTGATSVTKSGIGTWVLSGANTYTGVTTTLQSSIPNNHGQSVQIGTLVATTLANGGSPSSIGQSTSAATNLLIGNGTVLKYTGGAASTDRAFTINGTGDDGQSGALDASGSGAINWTSTAAVAYGTTAKTRTLTLTGSNAANNTLSALIGNNGASAVSLAKAGQGTWVLNGPVVNTYTGGTSVNTGTLVGDFANLATPTNLINSGSALTLGGGTLSLLGKNNVASSQSFTGNPTFSSQAGSGISLTGVGTGTMDLTLTNAWTRNEGSTLNVTLGLNGTLSSSPGVANGLVVGNGNIAFATVGGTDWAKVSAGTVTGFAPGDYNTTFPASGATSTVNYSLTDNASVTTSESANTLKINTTAGGQSLAITTGQTLTLNAGGLLFTGANDYSITGGTLAGSGGTQKDLVVHQFGSGNLTISSALSTSTGLTKTGTGTLILDGANTNTGATFIGGGGTLVLKNQLALQNSVLSINNSSLVFDSSVAANAFTFGGLSASYAGPGYDVALQNNAGSPAPIALTVGANNATGGNYFGTLSGAGSLIKVGTGTQTLSGLNTYTGGTIVSAGTLAGGIAGNDLFLGLPGSVNVTVQSNATLALNRNAITGTLTLNGGTLFTSNGFGSSWDGSVILGDGTTSIISNSSGGGIDILAAISGSGGLTRIGTTGTILSGYNTYTGATTISGGTLSVGQAYNLGAPAANLVVDGGTLQVTGTALMSLSGLGRTNPITFTPGKTVVLDINTAANVFTADQVLNQGSGGLTKLGAGTLVLNQANTYTGLTTISAGTLRLDDGADGAFWSQPLLDNGTLVVNRSDNRTQGTNFPALIGGTGSVNNTGSGTLTLNAPTYYTGTTKATAGAITLSHNLAIQYSALDTTGAGAVTLSGVTTPTFGGLSGATGNLASVITTGYGGVTALTLNPQSGITFTYGGVISDGSGNMPLTKSGAGTQVLQGANTFTGATNVNVGTLTVSGASGTIKTSSGITFNGGGLTLSYADSDAEKALDRVSDTAAITSNGGTITYTTTTLASTKVFAETIGSVALTSGQLNIVESLNKTAGSQTLTLAGLTRSGAANTSAVTFSSAGSRTTFNQIVVSGAAATDTNKIIGPWATIGTTAALQTDYAIYNASAQVVERNATPATSDAAWTTTWADTSNYAWGNGTTGMSISVTKNINTLRHTGGAETLTLASANLGTLGILNGVATALTIAATGTGAVTLPTTVADKLYVTTGSGAITISAPINDNGGALTLVKSGTGGTLTLSGASNYTGGTTINAGTVVISNATSFGGGNVLVTGSSQINATGGITYGNAINVGAPLTMLNPATGTSSTATFSGVLSGSSSISLPNSGAGGIQGIIAFTNPANTFTGDVVLSASGSGDEFFSFNSIGDAGNFTLAKNGNRQGIIYTGGSNITFGTRQINIASTMVNYGTRQGLDGGGGNPVSIFGNDGVGTVTFTSNMAMTSLASDGILYFHGNNSGDNTFAGTIGDPIGTGKLWIGKLGTGNWILTGDNTYEGGTIVANGILSVNKIADAATPQPLGIGSTIQFGVGNNGTSGTLVFTGAINSTTNKQVVVGAQTQANGTGSGSILNNGNGTLTFSNPTFNPSAGAITVSRTLTLGGTNTGTNEIQGVIQNNNGTTGPVALAVSGSVWQLAGANTYTGATSVTAGTLQLDGSTHASSTVGIATAGTLTGSGTVNGNATLTGNGVINKSAGTIAGTLAVTGGNWNGAGVVTGLVTSSSGVFNIGGGANLTANGNLNVTGGSFSGTDATSTLTGSLNYTSTTTSSFGGVIAGSGKTVTVNAATTRLALGGTNTYDGATTVGAGLLTVDATGTINNTSGVSIGGGNFNYNSSTALTRPVSFSGTGGTLSGTGTIGTAVNVTTGNSHAPGNSAGIQEFSNSLAYAANSSLQWQLMTNKDNATGTAGTDFDQVSVTGGTFAITTGAKLSLLMAPAVDFSDLFWTSARQWTIANLTSGVTADGGGEVFALDFASIGGTNWSASLASRFAVTRPTDGDGKNDVVLNWLGDPYTIWTQAKGLDGSNNGLSQNPDVDGYTNLVEYAFDTDPLSALSGPGAVEYDAVAHTISKHGQPTITVVKHPETVEVNAVFGRRKDYAVAGLTYTVQFSADMSVGSWESSAAIPSVLASDATLDVVQVPYPLFLSNGKKAAFFRVEITKN